MIPGKPNRQSPLTQEDRRAKLLFLALGTNLGNRKELLDTACRLIARDIAPITARSRHFVTRPVGFVSDHLFLNAAVSLLTDLPVSRILAITQQIEQEMGRTRKSVNGVHYDRPIDIDLLFYGNETVQTPTLTLPHPHLHERRFVLEPLCDIAPDWVHPTLQLTMKELLDRLNIPQIRRWTATDCTAENLAAVSRLLPQLSATATVPNETRFKELLTAPHIHIFAVYDEEQTVCGMATLTVDPLLTGTKAWIEDVVIGHEYRGRGYAKALIHHLVHYATQTGADSINLTSRPEREAANRLYKACGFEQRTTNVYRRKCQIRQD